MRISTLLFVLLISIQQLVLAQQPQRKLVTNYPASDTGKTVDIRERLVQLALQNPSYEVADRRVAVADYQLRSAKSEWLTIVQLQANVNQLTVQPKKDNSIFYPLYNVTFALPLSFVGMRVNAVKIARQNILIAEAEKNDQYRKIRTAVLSKYEDYLMWRSRLERQTRIAQDAYLNYRQKEKDFQDGLILLDDYNRAYQLYSNEQNSKEEVQRNLNVTKIELEEMIGVNLDEVIGKK